MTKIFYPVHSSSSIRIQSEKEASPIKEPADYDLPKQKLKKRQRARSSDMATLQTQEGDGQDIPPDRISKFRRTKARIGRCRDKPCPEASISIDYDHEASSSTSPLPDADSKANETCFFWYHGRCARSLDPKRSKPCPYMHALTHTPIMVRPPPRYVHRQPCGLEWCSGDSLQGGKGAKRARHGLKKPLERVRAESNTDPQHSAGNDDAVSETVSCGQVREEPREEWFLEGFA
ncbi:hypothetical protein LTR86_010173 [Recurvomyces mirabilis]|nr:hypothetical protein LTR86_010173 [Recurvomyces mirabilis]